MMSKRLTPDRGEASSSYYGRVQHGQSTRPTQYLYYVKDCFSSNGSQIQKTSECKSDVFYCMRSIIVTTRNQCQVVFSCVSINQRPCTVANEFSGILRILTQLASFMWNALVTGNPSSNSDPQEGRKSRSCFEMTS